METRTLEGYVYTGILLRFLRHAGADTAGVIRNINNLLEKVATLGTPVTLQASKVLAGISKKLSAESGDQPVPPSLASSLLEEYIAIERVLGAETGTQVAHIVTSQCYDVNGLLKDFGALIGKEDFESLPKLAQYDLQQAGRCIAFELPTAAAFHFLRALEGILKHLYLGIVKSGRLAAKDQMWGLMIKKLEQRKSKPKGLDLLLPWLDQIRKDYRNPTQHPELIYDLEQAHRLMQVCLAAVGLMAAIIRKKPIPRPSGKKPLAKRVATTDGLLSDPATNIYETIRQGMEALRLLKGGDAGKAK